MNDAPVALLLSSSPSAAQTDAAGASAGDVTLTIPLPLGRLLPGFESIMPRSAPRAATPPAISSTR